MSGTVNLRRRPSRTVPATLTAVVLLAVAVLVVIVVLARLINGGWPTAISGLQTWLRSLTWGGTTVVAIALLAVLLGLVLVVAVVKPGGLSAATLAAPGRLEVGEVEYVISHRGLAHLAVAAADTVDGVERVRASASGRRVVVAVTTASTGTADIRTRVHERVGAAMSQAGVQPAPQLRVGVRTREL